MLLKVSLLLLAVHLCAATSVIGNQTNLDDEPTPLFNPDDSLIEFTGRKQFYLRNKSVKYFEAIQLCIDEGRRLASVDNAQQKKDLDEQLGSYNSQFFIAGIALGRAGHWIWLIKSQPIGYTNWASGEPSGGVDNCLEVNAFGRGKWNDVSCDVQRNYICEDVDTLI